MAELNLLTYADNIENNIRDLELVMTLITNAPTSYQPYLTAYTFNHIFALYASTAHGRLELFFDLLLKHALRG